MRKIKLSAAAFALATGAFLFVMATQPPKTVAEPSRASISVQEIAIPADLTTSEASGTY
jgi:hypothetical protein